MQLPALLDRLGYTDARGRFLKADSEEFQCAQDFGHIFRHAADEEHGLGLHGVYVLRPPPEGGSMVPIVYVCEAEDDKAAREVHRLAWNQDVVPFVIVLTRHGVRLYSGFRFDAQATGEDAGELGVLIAFNQIQDLIDTFHAEAIDSGEIWRRRGRDVRPESRVYWKLLDNLRKLDEWLCTKGGLTPKVSHPLIGKYVYLNYLTDRGILSPERLDEWGIEDTAIFGRKATRAGLAAVSERLDDMLNGSIFPLKFRGPNAPSDEAVSRVAGAFHGDDFHEASWQFHLDFQAYNFSFIPIETLSMIYEQFLHLPVKAETEAGEYEHTEGRKAGAYYTPIPVVNFMLAELDEHRRLERGVTVFDPSCGSGAFLVQCYRRLIEREHVRARKARLTPAELRDLLTKHIFGVDLDEDACNVAEFSLVLTLLDYVDPPDLRRYPTFRLPTLRDANIFCTDFFSEKPPLADQLGQRRFHWIAGNPPWKQLSSKKLEPRDKLAMKWMQAHAKDLPVGKNALAQAFAWRCREYLHPDGECALLIPAMTLFEDPSQSFRAAFFREHRVHTVANFSNLAEVLFAGRSRVPAAALFFRLRSEGEAPEADETVTTFSPLVANQEPTRRKREENWGIVVNGSEVRDVRYEGLTDGSGFPWKLATWGSELDARLLERLARRWPRLEELEAVWIRKQSAFVAKDTKQVFGISEGLQLRDTESATEDLDPIPEVRDQKELKMKALARLRRVFDFPRDAIHPIPQGFEWARKGRGKLALAVCYPPHVIIGETRTFAVYSNKFLVFPGRQIGIRHLSNDHALLKALALFLSSDFAFYHQFFKATCFGVKRPIATLDSLRDIPVPLTHESIVPNLPKWVELHNELSATVPNRVGMNAGHDEMFGASNIAQSQLLSELNKMVANALGLDARDNALIDDLVHVRLALDDGNIGKRAVRNAPDSEIQTYARWLRRELDTFVGDSTERRHAVTVVYDAHSAMVAVDFTKDREAAHQIRVLEASTTDARTLERTRQRLRTERAQWVYFDRALRIYEGRKTYLFKPRQRFHWTRTQAMIDAGEIIADTLVSTPA